MKMTIEMPVVAECTVMECAYNLNTTCHAKAITVGDGIHPGCDTYLEGTTHTKRERLAGVGACKVIGCSNNEDFECIAQRITVGFKGGTVDCLTYSAR